MDGGFALEGTAWVFGDNLDADRDICPLEEYQELVRRGIPLTAEALGGICLGRIAPWFARQVRPGDLLVAGENVGASVACLDGDPNDPHGLGAAPLALKGAGIGAVLCRSSNMTFLRNAWEHGLPVVECAELRGRVSQGNRLLVDLEAGTISNRTTGEVLSFVPYPPFLVEMARAVQQRERDHE